ncbi:MAG: hypothetical protein ACRC3Z_01125, partial [Phocaeicola sp.]
MRVEIKNTMLRHHHLLLSWVFIMLLITACQEENHLVTPPLPPTENEAMVSLTLNISDFREVGTRSLNETEISSFVVLLMINNGSTEQVRTKYTLSAGDIHIISSGTTNTTAISFPTTSGTYSRIILVANAETELASILAGSSYTSVQEIQATEKYNSTTIPMYGEYAPIGGIQMQAGVSKIFADEIPLIRMLARVDILNQPSSGATLVETVRYVNPVKNGLIFVNSTAYTTGYTTPTLPNALQPANTRNVLESNPLPIGTNSVSYYLHEQPASSSESTNSGLNRPCIVVKMKYNGQDYFYRLDYTWDGVKTGGTKGTYMPILRNHRYIFSIQSVNGPGFTSIDEALRSPENHTNLTNIVVTPFVIDNAFTDVTFNSSGHFLAVSHTSMTLKGEHTTVSTDNSFSVQTSYPEGWNITSYNADGTVIVDPNPWLQPTQTSGIANSTSTIQAITDGKNFRNGYLEVRAGRLYTKVNVSQSIKLPLEYVAEFNLAGGFSNYGVAPINGATTAQTDNNLRWAINHNSDQSGYYNWYICKGIINPILNPTGKHLFSDTFLSTGLGYHLPSREEWVGIFGEKMIYGVVHSSTVSE